MAKIAQDVAQLEKYSRKNWATFVSKKLHKENSRPNGKN
jgi:hypothetical protein